VSLLVGAIVFAVTVLCGVPRSASAVAGSTAVLLLASYLLYFFRDPQRTTPQIPDAVIAPADGVVAQVTELDTARFLEIARFCGMSEAEARDFSEGSTTRISIFLSLLNVHVNRSPISGSARFLGYFPGRHIFTFDEKSSDKNQHNSILITNSRTVCLLNQIVGPVCRRVVYWPDHNKAVDLKCGDRIGMMKFGSRLDLYFPTARITLAAKPGEKTRAGETIIAHLTGN
jgi:phosphatidylserine decarboxylase